MKINEVITEIANPYLRGIVKGITGIEYAPKEPEVDKEEPTLEPTPAPSPKSTPTPTFKHTPSPTPTPTSAPVPSLSPAPTTTTTGLPAGVSVLSSSPLVLQVGKKKFELDDMDQWHPLGSKRIVSPGEAAILNKYLAML